MHYSDLTKIQSAADVDGAQLLLGEISAIGPEALTLRSVLGSQHGLTMIPHDFLDACRPGQFAIVCELGDRWSLLGAHSEYLAAAAALPGELVVAAKTRAERAALVAAREQREQEERAAELAAAGLTSGSAPAGTGEPTDPDAAALARAKAELGGAGGEPDKVKAARGKSKPAESSSREGG